EGDTVTEVESSIAKGEKLRSQEVLAPQSAQPKPLADEERLKALFPFGRKILCEGSWTVVQPVVSENLASVTTGRREGQRSRRNVWRNFGVEHVAVFRRSADDAEKIQGRAADNDPFEAQSPRVQKLAEGFQRLPRIHYGISITDATDRRCAATACLFSVSCVRVRAQAVAEDLSRSAENNAGSDDGEK
ncbi:MAG: hypothetical protein ABIT01_03120, partial [Thermoanaerobaculia bacterium]